MSNEISQIFSTGIALIGGLGLGSLLTTYLKDRFDRKHFKYREKLSVYAGYLEALQNSVINTNEEAKQKVVYWQLRMRLISPRKIDEIAYEFYKKDRVQDFTSLRDEIVHEMKRDLDRSI
ncbi:hypothetical protein [Asticcacaulis sp.]|uniref:hypothetical protein n=1 Tax=Asticcacaulis sp. TaxID=1872648 RepID=UPI003F7C83F9